jgi:hypothetical protein
MINWEDRASLRAYAGAWADAISATGSLRAEARLLALHPVSGRDMTMLDGLLAAARHPLVLTCQMKAKCPLPRGDRSSGRKWPPFTGGSAVPHDAD